MDTLNTMDINGLIEQFGEPNVLVASGVIAGLLFGIFAQRSRFCMRAAVIEAWNRENHGKIAIWLVGFATAIIASQFLISQAWLDVSQSRQMTALGSISAAGVGGFLFGIGMVLARGCSSRMLVLAANGNLRALLTGLVFTLTAIATAYGSLSPLARTVTNWWAVEDPNSLDVLAQLQLGNTGGIAIGLLLLCCAIYLAIRTTLNKRTLLYSAGVGFSVALAWLITFKISSQSFEMIPVQSLSFTGPSADILMLLVAPSGQPWVFNTGLVPGVILGSFLAALFNRELQIEKFKDVRSVGRYFAGAILMGFGGVLAGGCAVGAGVASASIFALSAWISLVAMWLGAGLSYALIDAKAEAHKKAATAKLLTVADTTEQT